MAMFLVAIGLEIPYYFAECCQPERSNGLNFQAGVLLSRALSMHGFELCWKGPGRSFFMVKAEAAFP
jgi:hypothetical protein